MTRFFCVALTIVVGGLFAAIGWKILTGEIKLDGILSSKRSGLSKANTGNIFSPGRVQLVATTVITATYYLTHVVHDPARFPSIPKAWLLGLGASQGIYLGGKAVSAFLGVQNLSRRRQNNEK